MTPRKDSPDFSSAAPMPEEGTVFMPVGQVPPLQVEVIRPGPLASAERLATVFRRDAEHIRPPDVVERALLTIEAERAADRAAQPFVNQAVLLGLGLLKRISRR
jgi:hypothetical protein